MIIRIVLALAVVISLGVLAAGCSSGSSVEDSGRLSVVVTTSMLADIAKQIVGTDADIVTLLPIGIDPHDFQPSSSQVTQVYNADLVIGNGLGLEGTLLRLLNTAADDGVRVLLIGPLVDPVRFEERTACDGAADITCDPHVWLDPDRNEATAKLIAEELTRIDASKDWETRARQYAAEMADADANIVQILAAVPPGERLIVANHGFLGYFADRYAFDVIGSVIPGGGTVAAPTSAGLADLVAIINQTGVRAIFAETTDSIALAEAVAAEADHEVKVVRLLSGSLDEPGSEADTLIGMLISNARLIAEALAGSG